MYDQETAKMQCRILEKLYVMYYSKQQQQQWKTDQELFFRYDLVTKLFTWLLYNATIIISYRANYCYQSQQIDFKWCCTRVWSMLLQTLKQFLCISLSEMLAALLFREFLTFLHQSWGEIFHICIPI